MKSLLRNKHRHFIPHVKVLIWQVGQPIKNKANLPLLSAGENRLGNLAALGDEKGGEL